ncbi:MAG TPA: hypothetical protein VIU13_14375 [Chryseolinea sp.]
MTALLWVNLGLWVVVLGVSVALLFKQKADKLNEGAKKIGEALSREEE